MRKLILLLLPLSAFADTETNWTLDTSGDPAIHQDADGTIKDESYTSDVTPRLSFRCAAGGEILAQIDWRRFISSFNTEVGFKVDDGKFSWLKWKVDGSEKITISPSATDTQQLFDAMSGGARLIVDVTPYSESPVVVEFDLAGFAAALGDLQAACQ